MVMETEALVLTEEKENFQQFFETKILPMYRVDEESDRIQELESLNCYRLFVFAAMFVVAIIGLGLAKVVVASSGAVNIKLCGIFFALLFSTTILVSALSYDCFNFEAEREYKRSLKENYLLNILKYFGDFNWWFDCNTLTNDEIRQSGLFPKYKERKVFDELSGKYRDKTYVISKNKLVFRNPKTWYTLFRIMNIQTFEGIVISIPLNKEVLSQTIISDKQSLKERYNLKNYALELLFRSSFIVPFLLLLILLFGLYGGLVDILFLLIFSQIYSYLIKRKNAELLGKLDIEELKLEDLVVVYSTEDRANHFVISPLLVERLLNIKRVFGVNNIKCSFYDNRLIIAMETKQELFDIGDLHESLYNDNFIKRIQEEIESIHNLIDCV